MLDHSHAAAYAHRKKTQGQETSLEKHPKVAARTTTASANAQNEERREAGEAPSERPYLHRVHGWRGGRNIVFDAGRGGAKWCAWKASMGSVQYLRRVCYHVPVFLFEGLQSRHARGRPVAPDATR